jgi:biopolymer transport protein ExbD
MLHEWLLAGRIERTLARDVAWPLLSGSASAEALESMCLREGLACVRVAEDWGLALPLSGIDLLPRGGTAVRIAATELSVDQTPVLTLASGRPAAGAFVQHVAPALQQALTARAGHGRMHAERELGTPWPSRVELVADRATPFGTIVDVLFTATAAGFDEAELVVLGDGLRAIPLHRPGAEPEPHPHLRYERPLAFTLLVHRDSVEAGADMMSPLRHFPNLPGCEPSSSLCVDRETVAAMSKQLESLFPHESEVTVRVDADVPLEVVVALIDAARGEGCRLQPALEGGEVPPECHFFRAIVDAEPPLLFPARPQAVEEEPR